jgi:hypothetical protein
VIIGHLSHCTLPQKDLTVRVCENRINMATEARDFMVFSGSFELGLSEHRRTFLLTTSNTIPDGHDITIDREMTVLLQ